jgi:hypothetical protein
VEGRVTRAELLARAPSWQRLHPLDHVRPREDRPSAIPGATAIATFAALIFTSMPGSTTQAAISAFMNPGDTLVSNYTPFHADVQTCSNYQGLGNITDLTHLPVVYLATLHEGSLPQRAWVM